MDEIERNKFKDATGYLKKLIEDEKVDIETVLGTVMPSGAMEHDNEGQMVYYTGHYDPDYAEDYASSGA